MALQRAALTPPQIVRKTLVKKIQSAQELQALIQVLAVDLGRVHDYFSLFRKLMRARQGRYTLAMSQSQTFWSLVFGGLHEAALSALCRAYDQTNHDEVLTLRTLLETIEARPPFLPPTASKISATQLTRDIRSVSKEHSTPVAHLSKWRNKLYAHRDATKILSSRTLADEFPIKYQEIDTLLRRGFNIANRYSVTLFNNSYLPGLIGEDDYLAVLQTIQRAVRRAEREMRLGAGLVRRARKAARI